MAPKRMPTTTMLVVTAMLCMALGASAAGAPAAANSVISLDGDGWLLATDPHNAGVAEKWFAAPRPDAKPTRIPWTIQAVFPGYAGVAWYWRDVTVPANPDTGGRYILRFWDVDYFADVYVNGVHIGSHEGAQVPFTLDATQVVKPGAANRIAVRVVSAFDKPIEGFVRSQTPHGGYTPLNIGGIPDSVELIIAPQVRIDALYVRADPTTGTVHVQTAVCNESNKTARAFFEFSIAPAASGEPVCTAMVEQDVEPGPSTIEAELQVADHRLWELDNPYLYRITARVAAAGSKSVDETSTRFGFRELRFENGYFRLNGRRIFWRHAHTGGDAPGIIRVPHDPGLLRRDMLNLKAMGFTGVRFISTNAQRYQLDLCDEIGLMVYEESYASWFLQDSPHMAERMDRSLAAMVRRDRNHPSVVIWGIVNETGDGPVFRHAAATLSVIRALDDTRIVMLGSGRWDAQGNFTNGLQIWRGEGDNAPNVIYNPKPYGICLVPLWPSKAIALNPGSKGEYSVARWRAPTDGDHAVFAAFRGTGSYSTSDVHILHAGKPIFGSFINVNGHSDHCTYAGTAHLSQGQTLDFVVGGGKGYDHGPWLQGCGDNTTIAVTIRSADGKVYDLAADFSDTTNPNGVWSYGSLAGGPTPDACTLALYPKCFPETWDTVGGICNPGSDHWEDVLADQHYYPRVPHRRLEIERLRTIAGNDHNLFLSEYGVGSGIDLARGLRQCEQSGLDKCEQIESLRGRMAGLVADWDRLKLGDVFSSPEEYFRQSVARNADLRTMGINALRSNPRIIAYGLTGCSDSLWYGEGLTTAFRDVKPGMMDALYDAFHPVRWCTFAEPVSLYRGSTVHVEAVLANEDSAAPGTYPARVQIVGPNSTTILDREIEVTIPGCESGREPTFAFPVFAEDVAVHGPTGKYRFLISFQRGVFASGGEAAFYLTDPAEMPPVATEVVMWGDDPDLAKWLADHGINVLPYQPEQSGTREVIIVSYAPAAGGTLEAWRDLATRIAKGSTAIFLTLDVLKRGDDPLGWLPLANKGTLGMVSEYTFPQVYPKDEWAKRHPLFDGLPCGGLMDYTFYREIIPDYRYWGQDTPAEAVCGAIRTSVPSYHSEMVLSVYDLGAGRFILNALRVRQTLGEDPAAERLLRNMLLYAATDDRRPVVPRQERLNALLKEIGYE